MIQAKEIKAAAGILNSFQGFLNNIDDADERAIIANIVTKTMLGTSTNIHSNINLVKINIIKYCSSGQKEEEKDFYRNIFTEDTLIDASNIDHFNLLSAITHRDFKIFKSLIRERNVNMLIKKREWDRAIEHLFSNDSMERSFRMNVYLSFVMD